MRENTRITRKRGDKYYAGCKRSLNGLLECYTDHKHLGCSGYGNHCLSPVSYTHLGNTLEQSLELIKSVVEEKLPI